MAIETDFSGKSALITGAASGIGAACAKWLCSQNIGRLVLADRDEAGLGALDLPCPTDLIVGDVGDTEFWRDSQLGTLDHAIINAGIAEGAPLAAMDFAAWRRIMSVNLDGAFLSLQSAMRAMDKGGSIVALSSVSGLKPMAGTGAYGASKAALIHLVKVAALEGAEQSIRVNAIAPGGVDTPIWDGIPDFNTMVAEQGREAAIKAMAAGTPNGRMANPAEIAQTIGFLLSDAADNITGAVLSSDGGFSV